MKTFSRNAAKGRGRTGRPDRNHALRRKGVSRREVKTFLVRCWWALRGAAAGSIVLAVLYGGYLGAGKLVSSPWLAVKNIQIHGCRQIEPKGIAALSGIRAGQPLLKVDIARVRARLLSHPAVRDASVARELPGTLRVQIEERVPAAVVLDGGFTLVDGEGVVLARSEAYAGDYPVITGVADIPEAGQVAAQAVPALEALEEMASAGFPEKERVSEVRVSGERLLVFLTGSGTMLVLPGRKVSEALERLAQFVEAGAFDPAAPGYDLRFAGRVVALPDGSAPKGVQGRKSSAGG